MTAPSETENIPQTSIDPVVFIYQNRKRILLYIGVILAAAVIYVAYQFMAQRKLEKARQLFAEAGTEDDYRQIAQQYPHTVIGGNATLLLAEKLRAEKKYDDAAVLVRTLVNQYPEYPLIDGANLALASILDEQGKYDDALSAYQQVASQYPASYVAPQALLAQAAILKSQGKLDEARQKLENVKAQFPNTNYDGEAMREMQLLKR